MKTLRKLAFFAAFVIAISLTSCMGLNTLPSSNVNSMETNVTLSSNNYEVVKSVCAEKKATYYFGAFGGMKKAYLEKDVIYDLTQEAQLKGSQALINVATSSQVKSYFGVVTHVTTRATGTVIQFK